MDYSKILKRSWEITWKNKWLWIPALVLSSFSGGGGSGGGGGSSSNSSQSAPEVDPNTINDVKEKASDVLGATTDYLSYWFASVSVSDWIFFGVLVFTLVVIGMIVILTLTNWAKGALILGFEDADNNKEVTLKSISPYGWANVKKLIIFGLISTGMSLLTFISTMIIVGLGYLLTTLLGVFGTILLVFLGIFGFLFFLFVILIFTMISVYAERLIVIKGFSPWEAWKKGLSLSRGNFFSTLVMGIINSALGFSVGCLGVIALLILFAVPSFMLVYPIFKDGFVVPSIPQIAAIIFFIVLFFSINLMIKAVFTVFKYGNWNLFFKEVSQKKETK